MIYIGTSGFSYADWKGVFYPEKIAKNRMFSFYTQVFNATEINFSFYVLPRPEVYETLLKDAPEDFRFIIKAYRGITHKTSETKSDIEKFLYSIKPFYGHPSLGGILLQFPYSYRFSESNLTYLKRIKEYFSTLETSLFVEFRHRSWFCPEVFSFLKENELAYCSVDEPLIPGLMPPALVLTTSEAYIRFHSRDRQKWFKGEKERYDYNYTIKEFNHWIKQLQKQNPKPSTLYVFFNNCQHAYAPLNALDFKKLLSGISFKT